jgi:hypothetical protein
MQFRRHFSLTGIDAGCAAVLPALLALADELIE